VEHFTNKSFSDAIIVSDNELSELKKKLKSEDKFFTFSETSVETSDSFYSSRDNKKIVEWERKQSLPSIDYYICPLLSEYILSSCHYGTTFDFINDPFYDPSSIKLIDHIKSYFNFRSCKYFNDFKFANAPSVFMKLPPDFNFKKYPGIYTITNVKNRPPIFETMKVYESDSEYTAPDLQFLLDLGCTFDILAGAFSFTSRDIDFNGLYKAGGDYRIWPCKQASIQHYFVTNIFGNKDLAEQLAYELGPERVKYFEDTIRLYTRKIKSTHRAYITSYILAYSRIQILDQLLKFNPDDLVRIQLDGIYFKKNAYYQPNETFRAKEVKTNATASSESYMSYRSNRLEGIPDYNSHYINQYICAYGPGGSGKSFHFLQNSPQLVNPVYSALSHNLLSDKNSPNKCTWARLLGENCTHFDGFAQCIILDEFSIFSQDRLNKLIPLYPNSMIIFAGDECQLTPYKKPAAILSSFYQLEFTKLFRFLNKKTRTLCRTLREAIKRGATKEDLIAICRLVCVSGTDDNYNVNDYIITGTNDRVDYFTKKHENKEKRWRITKTSRRYNAGVILIQDEQPLHGNLQHAFTAHSTIGLTIYPPTKLFIDVDYMFQRQMIYTVVARARDTDQIILI